MRVIRAGQVFDGTTFRGAADVVVDGATIVGVANPGDYAEGVEVEDLGEGATVLPGLIDAHLHLTWNCSEDPVGWFGHDAAVIADRARINARRALAAGVTTVRDLGGPTAMSLRLRHETTTDPSAGPALLVSGSPVTTTGGHCWFLGGEVGDLPTLRQRVAALVEAGVDVVKVMVTGGNVTPGSAPHISQFGVAELITLVEIAHEAGIPVAAHAHGTEGIRTALRAGVDTLEHASFMSAHGVADDPGLVDQIVRSQTPVVFTAGQLPGPLPPAIAARMSALLEHVRRLIDAGAAWILSTDAGIGPPKPHDVLPHAVTQAEEVGVPVETALSRATAVAADALGIADRAGRLAAGRRADLLVVNGRVDREPAALHDVRAVWRAGQPVAI